MQYDLGKINTKAIAIIAGVSQTRGLELYMQFQKSINGIKFKIFLWELRQKYKYEKIALMLDNSSVHKSKKV